MNDNVKPFPTSGDLPENPLQIAERPPGWCSHESVMLDEQTRTVRCANLNCGAVLDPFAFLLNNAQLIRRAWQAHAQAMRSANEVAERVSALKKEEQRLRAMIKRLQEKSGAVLTVREPQP